MDLNYSALESSKVFKKYKNIFEGQKNTKNTVLKLIGSLLGFAFILLLMPDVTPLVIALIFIITGAFVYKALTHSVSEWKATQKVLTQFAEQNHFHYSKIEFAQHFSQNIPDLKLNLPFKARMIFNTGHMTGKFYGMPFEYINGTFQIANDDGSTDKTKVNESQRSVSALAITLPVKFSKLLVDSKQNNVAGTSYRINNIEKVQEYILEGNFPDEYSVFAEKDNQIDTLSVLTPEVMQKLLSFRRYDIWINGDQLVIFNFSNPNEYLVAIPHVFETLEMLLRETDKIARNLRQNSII